MEREQQQRFADAVERKAKDAEIRSQVDSGAPSGPAGQEAQESRTDPGRGQETGGPRDKSSRHGQVTADKWNQ
jgi:hypothetical protein